MHLSCFHVEEEEELKENEDDGLLVPQPPKHGKKKAHSLTSYNFMNRDGQIICSDSKSFHIESIKQHRQIEKELKKHSKNYHSTIRLLLLGPGESGKSTVLKQMRLIHSSFYTQQEKLENFTAIKVLIRDSMLLILNAMDRFDMAFEQNHEHLDSVKAWLMEHAQCSLLGDSVKPDGFNMEKFWDCIEALWKSNVVKQIARRGMLSLVQ